MEKFNNIESFNNDGDERVRIPSEEDFEKLGRPEYNDLTDKQYGKLEKLNEGKDNLVDDYSKKLERIGNDNETDRGQKLESLYNMKNDVEDFKDYYDKEKQNIVDNPDDANPEKKLTLKM